MRRQLLDQLAENEVVRRGVAPAVTLAVAYRGASGWHVYTGVAGQTSYGVPTAADTVFDLASVSKPHTAVLTARLVESGAFEWSTPLGELLPSVHGTLAESATLDELLSHRSGLEAHLALFAPLVHQEPFRVGTALRLAANAKAAEHGPQAGAPAVYSDLGYLLVGAALEQATQEPLDELMVRELCEPLGSRAASARIWARRRREFASSVAPTEVVHWRGGTLRGVVHDENSWALSGHGACGHAGLFATVHDVVRLGTTMLDALSGRTPTILSERAARHLVQERPGGTLRCGFDGKSGDAPSAGPSASARSFGHLGYTGTSLWCDPESDVVTVMLTNRVHPTRENWKIRDARPVVHDNLFKLGRDPAALGAGRVDLEA